VPSPFPSRVCARVASSALPGSCTRAEWRPPCVPRRWVCGSCLPAPSPTPPPWTEYTPEQLAPFSDDLVRGVVDTVNAALANASAPVAGGGSVAGARLLSDDGPTGGVLTQDMVTVALAPMPGNGVSFSLGFEVLGVRV
jgi:hypothetical protein